MKRPTTLSTLNRASEMLLMALRLKESTREDIVKAMEFLKTSNPDIIVWVRDLCAQIASAPTMVLPTDQRTTVLLPAVPGHRWFVAGGSFELQAAESFMETDKKREDQKIYLEHLVRTLSHQTTLLDVKIAEIEMHLRQKYGCTSDDLRFLRDRVDLLRQIEDGLKKVEV
jgi:hypothetical protein